MLVDFAFTDDPGSTSYMYGAGSWYDGPCARDYDPYQHAAALDLPIVYRELPDEKMVAAYSAQHRAIFVRPNLHGAVERCAVAHEIVHHEHGDVGHVPAHEQRADRIAARRLIRPRRLRDADNGSGDPAAMALELNVTERIMTTYLRGIERGWYGHL